MFVNKPPIFLQNEMGRKTNKTNGITFSLNQIQEKKIIAEKINEYNAAKHRIKEYVGHKYL